MKTIVAYLGKGLAAISRPLNAIKDGYLAAVQWVDEHPHKTLWFATGALIAALVLV